MRADLAPRCVAPTSLAVAVSLVLSMSSGAADSSTSIRATSPTSDKGSKDAPYHVAPALLQGRIPVTNCDDGGNGSLRGVLENVATSGDTVDLTELTCGLITLTTGALVIDQNTLTLQGPGAQFLKISGAGTQLDFYHRGIGQLTINDLTIADGLNSQRDSAKGGCIRSNGYLSLNNTVVRDCIARTTSRFGSPDAVGGGAFSERGLEIFGTSILSNVAAHVGRASAPITDGGGIFSYGPITVVHSYLAGNVSTGLGGAVATIAGLQMSYTTIAGNNAHYVGGVSAEGEITIESSAIVDNVAVRVGGLAVGGASMPTTALVHNTTISGNTGDFASGLAIYGGEVEVANCTIAFNASPGSPPGAGIVVNSDVLDLESTIVAENTVNSSVSETQADIDGDGVVVGQDNLIVAPLIDVPSDTIGDDPQLLPLADNGGLTPTHALAMQSPAIDTGNNLLNAAYDQRGVGFARDMGAGADIGAFELFDERIFANGFE